MKHLEQDLVQIKCSNNGIYYHHHHYHYYHHHFLILSIIIQHIPEPRTSFPWPKVFFRVPIAAIIASPISLSQEMILSHVESSDLFETVYVDHLYEIGLP